MANVNEPTGINWRMNAVIARFAGIIAIALGFSLGIFGLNESGSPWLPTALGLLITGMLAQGYALFCSIKRMQELRDKPNT